MFSSRRGNCTECQLLVKGYCEKHKKYFRDYMKNKHAQSVLIDEIIDQDTCGKGLKYLETQTDGNFCSRYERIKNEIN